MKIYKCILCNDEMFSDVNKMVLVDDVIYEVYGKLVTRKESDVALEGSNPSTEEPAEEGSDPNVQSGVDIILNNRLVKTYCFDKKGYTLYLKEYMKKIAEILKEKHPDQVALFKTNMTKAITPILKRFDDFELFLGEHEDLEGMVGLLEYRDIDGVDTPVMLFFKHGLVEEKL